jgi:enoyl-CoA hydratase/carnithine racemase
MIRLPRAIPSRKAKEMIYAGEPISSQEAEKIGLVNRVVPRAQLQAHVNEVASKLVNKSTLALRVAKTIINHGLETADIDGGLIMERGAVGIFTAGGDSKEGVNAFLKKRSPQFQ